MKKIKLLPLLAVLLLLCAACGRIASPGPEASETPGPSAPALPGGPADNPRGDAGNGQQADVQTEQIKNSGLYDPSIFVIEAEGAWRQELAPGYYADYECELYIDKADANDNRSASGLYTGVFWMKTTLDTEEFLSDFLKDVPVEMEFNALGEGICDNLTVHLQDGFERDPFEDCAIPAEEGDPLMPAQDALADSGSFIAVGSEAYLEARAHGAAGEELEYQGDETADTEIGYVIHVEPDPEGTAAERKVTICLSTDEGMSVTLEGTWRRLPGYPEDMLEYANSGKQREILDKHLQ
jgi:hypothetical protein